MIGINILLLTGSYNATSVLDVNRLEWPPHPLRLFAALTSIVKTSTNPVVTQYGDAVLRILEQHQPSMRFSPLAGKPEQNIYAPHNDGVEGRRVTRTWKQGIPVEDQIWYIFPDLVNVEIGDRTSLFQVLQPMLRELTYLGHSSSMVSASLHQECPQPSHVPSSSGSMWMRTYGDGSLKDLEDHYKQHRDYAGILPYRDAQYQAVEQSHARLFGDAIVLERVGGVVLSSSEEDLTGDSVLLRLTKMIRHKLTSLLRTPTAMISGHNPDGSVLRDFHLGIFPLVFSGSDKADGTVKGFALTLPESATLQDRQELLRAVAAWESQYGTGDPGDEIGFPTIEFGVGDGVMLLRRVSERASMKTTDWNQWTRSSRMWSTVLPFTCPQYPSRGRSAESLIQPYLIYSRLPDPVRIECHDHSLHKGLGLASKCRIMSGRYSQYSTHVTVEFSEEVEGPVLFGSDIHHGFGICLPL